MAETKKAESASEASAPTPLEPKVVITVDDGDGPKEVTLPAGDQALIAQRAANAAVDPLHLQPGHGKSPDPQGESTEEERKANEEEYARRVGA